MGSGKGRDFFPALFRPLSANSRPRKLDRHRNVVIGCRLSCFFLRLVKLGETSSETRRRGKGEAEGANLCGRKPPPPSLPARDLFSVTEEIYDPVTFPLSGPLLGRISRFKSVRNARLETLLAQTAIYCIEK